MNTITPHCRFGALALAAFLLPLPVPAAITLREALDARRAAYRDNAARHEEQMAEAKLRAAVKEHEPWRRHARRLHKDLRLFYGRTGSDRLFLCGADGKMQNISEEDFAQTALEIEVADFDRDFSAADGSDCDIRVTERYPYTLHFRCRRVLEVSPERLRILAVPAEHSFEIYSISEAELIILHPTPKQMEMAAGDKIREYFTRAMNADGTPASSAAQRYRHVPVLKTYNTLKNDTRKPNSETRKKKH